MKHRLFALCLTLLLLVSLAAGCSSSTQTTQTDQTTQTTQTTQDTQTTDDTPTTDDTQPAEDTQDTQTPADDSQTTTDSYLPLVDEPTVLTGWSSASLNVDPNAALGDTPFWQWVAETTGITMQWNTVSSSAASEQFSLMLVSGDYEDIINYQARFYPNGLANAIDEEILADVSDLITGGAAPHYQALRESDEKIRRDTQLDDGRICGFYRILDTYQNSWAGPIIATELAAAAGVDDVDTLVTLDDWHDMFLAMSQLDNVEIAMELSPDGLDATFLSTFDIPRGYSYDNNFRHNGDTVEYSFTTEDYYNYLVTMKQWYDEGIFDANFFGSTGMLAFSGQDTIARGGVGCVRTIGSLTPTLSQISGLTYRAVAAPLQEGRTQRNVAMTDASFSRVEQNFWAITTACADQELAVKFVDFFYSDEAFLAINYGVDEGCYVLNEDGEPVFNDMMVRNEEFSYMDLISWYGGFGSAVGRYTWTAQFNNMDESAVYCYEAWDLTWHRDDDLYTLPMLSLTQEESETYSATFSDIQTYVAEMVIKFINGTEELTPASYEAYCNNIKAMRIDECTAILQDAYDRYLAR